MMNWITNMLTKRPTYLIAGLGNVGRRYRNNRHNIGFMILDAFAEHHGASFTRVQNNALVTDFLQEAGKVLLVKPQTMMNDSGKSIAAMARYYRVPLEHILVILDDLDLPTGKLRMRPHGGSGGHRGMRSIINQLGSQDFPRLRVGIGRPPGVMDPADYVLQDFSSSEQDEMSVVIQEALDVLDRFLLEGIDLAMNLNNADEQA